MCGYLNTAGQWEWSYLAFFLKPSREDWQVRWNCELWRWFPAASLPLKPKELEHRPRSPWLKMTWRSQQTETWRRVHAMTVLWCSQVFPLTGKDWTVQTTAEFYKENCTSWTPWMWKQVISFKKDFVKGQTVWRRNKGRMKRQKIVLYTDIIKAFCWLRFIQRRLREWLHVGL